MTSHETPGFLHRMVSALGRALRRGILGKSSQDYMKQFSGSDGYWDRVIAAQLDWPENDSHPAVDKCENWITKAARTGRQP